MPAATESPYLDVVDEVLAARTDFACEQAPQTGLHLYHFPLSLCSQKVRQALAEKRVEWESHVVMLPLGDQYAPDYVRLNPRCVVPTLVHEGRVTTDSANILRWIDATFEGPALIPEDPSERATVERFLTLADGLFMEVVTYGEVPGVRKPFVLRQGSKGSHHARVAKLDALIREHGDDPMLVRAYSCKRELVGRSIDTMAGEQGIAAVIDATDAAIAKIADQLDTGPFAAGGWLCGDEFSLADLEWGIVLNRLRWVGLAPRLWGQRPAVGRYGARLFARPGFHAGVLAWNHTFAQVVVPMLAKRVGARLRGQS